MVQSIFGIILAKFESVNLILTLFEKFKKIQEKNKMWHEKPTMKINRVGHKKGVINKLKRKL